MLVLHCEYEFYSQSSRIGNDDDRKHLSHAVEHVRPQFTGQAIGQVMEVSHIPHAEE